MSLPRNEEQVMARPGLVWFKDSSGVNRWVPVERIVAVTHLNDERYCKYVDKVTVEGLGELPMLHCEVEYFVRQLQKAMGEK